MSLPPPRGRQNDVVFMDVVPQTVVLGTAGTGKSLMAVHRAARLANHQTRNHGATLLVTFNKALCSYLQDFDDDGTALAGVETVNYSKLARDVCVDNEVWPRGWTPIAQLRERASLVSQAVDAVIAQEGPRPPLHRPTAFFLDEFDWIMGLGVSDEESYQTAERVGRSNPVRRGEPRSLIWKVYRRYRSTLAASEFVDDWPGLTARLHQVSARGEEIEFGYRHVVVDEFQDLTPEALRSLAALVPAHGSLTLFGDHGQQIYGSRMSWRQLGLDRPERVDFVDNFRNSTAIARLAIAMARQEFMTDIEDLVAPVAPNAPGDPPVLVHCRDVTEDDFVVARARAFARNQRVGLLFRTHALRDDLVANFRAREVDLVDGDRPAWPTGPGITATTYHSAKGLEFDTVILPHLSAEAMPDPEGVEAFGEAEAMSREGRLLYVGLTRAKSNLIMTHRGPVSRLLPAGALADGTVQVVTQ